MSAPHIIDSALAAAADLSLHALPLAVPNPDPIQPPGTEGFTTVMGWAKWITLAMCGGRTLRADDVPARYVIGP